MTPAHFPNVLSRSADGWGWGQRRGLGWRTHLGLPQTGRSPLSPTGGEKSVTRGPGVCDEKKVKGSALRYAIGRATRRKHRFIGPDPTLRNREEWGALRNSQTPTTSVCGIFPFIRNRALSSEPNSWRSAHGW